MSKKFRMRIPLKKPKPVLEERVDITDLSSEEFAKGWGKFEGNIEIVNGRKFLILTKATHTPSKKLIGHKGTHTY